MISTEQFSALTREEQIEGLEMLGREALAEFGVVPGEMKPLVHAENTTFRVDSEGGTFCLRISRPGYQSEGNILSELHFLSALTKEGFSVPAPFQDRLVVASFEQVPEPRSCVLFRWIDGEFFRGGLSEKQLFTAGAMMARLHSFSLDWRLPEGFDRQNLCAVELADRVPMAIDKPSVIAHEEDRLYLVELETEARAFFRSLPSTADWHGLIHADMHHGNLIFSGDTLSVIDFDDTGWGFWLSDMAAALAYEAASEKYKVAKQALMAGYLSVRALPPQCEELLDTFIWIRLFRVCCWLVSRSDNPGIRDAGKPWVNRLCNQIRALRV